MGKYKKIVKEIQRVLKDEGYLLCRVNSTKEREIKDDTNNIIEIQENYYNFKGKVMRFFDEMQLMKLFDAFDIMYIKEEKIPWYDKCNKNIVVEGSKIVWEIVLRKRKKD